MVNKIIMNINCIEVKSMNKKNEKIKKIKEKVEEKEERNEERKVLISLDRDAWLLLYKVKLLLAKENGKETATVTHSDAVRKLYEQTNEDFKKKLG